MLAVGLSTSRRSAACSLTPAPSPSQPKDPDCGGSPKRERSPRRLSSLQYKSLFLCFLFLVCCFLFICCSSTGQRVSVGQWSRHLRFYLKLPVTTCKSRLVPLQPTTINRTIRKTRNSATPPRQTPGHPAFEIRQARPGGLTT